MFTPRLNKRIIDSSPKTNYNNASRKMGAFMARLTFTQAFTVPVVWLYTKLFVRTAPETHRESKDFGSPRKESSSATETPKALTNDWQKLDLNEDFQSVGSPLQASCDLSHVEIESPGHLLPTVSSLAKKRMKVHRVPDEAMRKPTLSPGPSNLLLDDSGLSQSTYSDFTDDVGFPKHMLETASSLMKRRRKLHSDMAISPTKFSAKRRRRYQTKKDRALGTPKRLCKARECSYARQTFSSRRKCRQKLSIILNTTVPASSCA